MIRGILTRKKSSEKGPRTVQNNLGVPHSSALGAILFILYVNVHLCGKNTDDVRERMNEDRAKINDWLRLNKLKLNVSSEPNQIS